MLLENTDLLAIIIALAGAGVVMVISIIAYGRLYRENQDLRRALALRKEATRKGE